MFDLQFQKYGTPFFNVYVYFKQFPLVPEHLVKRWQMLPTFTILADGEIRDCLNEQVPMHTTIEKIKLIGHCIDFEKSGAAIYDYLQVAHRDAKECIAAFYVEHAQKQITFEQALQQVDAW